MSDETDYCDGRIDDVIERINEIEEQVNWLGEFVAPSFVGKQVELKPYYRGYFSNRKSYSRTSGKVISTSGSQIYVETEFGETREYPIFHIDKFLD